MSVKQEKHFYRVTLETNDTTDITSFLQTTKHRVSDLKNMFKKLFWSDIKVFV